jgi:hypothetical protein
MTSFVRLFVLVVLALHAHALIHPNNRLQAQSVVLQQVIDVRLRDVSLAAAIDSIARKAGLRLTYAKALLPANRRITIVDSTITVAAAFARALTGLDLRVVLTSRGEAALVQTTAADTLTDVIRGRVTGPDSAAVRGALVAATAVNGAGRKTARTNDNGEYSIVFAGGGGQYTVTAIAIGMSRGQVTAVGGSGTVIKAADIRLGHVKARLDAVRVIAPGREVPAKESVADADAPRNIGAQGFGTMSITTIEPQLGSSINDLLRRIAGVASTRTGASILGMDPSQNTTLLNGVRILGSAVPEALAYQGQLIVSGYDAGTGGYSGGQLGFETNDMSGLQSSYKMLTGTFDSPSLQWTDSHSRLGGQLYRLLGVGAAIRAPLTKGRDPLYVQLSADLTRRSSALSSLLRHDSESLARIGLATDSVRRALTVAGQRMPLGTANDRFTNQNVVTVDLSRGFETPHWRRLVLAASRTNDEGFFASPTATPSHTAVGNDWAANVQFLSTDAIRGRFLNELTLSFSRRAQTSTPTLVLPEARISVTSTLPSGSVEVGTIQTGGLDYDAGDERTTLVQMVNSTGWNTFSRRHRFKVSVEASEERFNVGPSRSSGVFVFNSVADFAENSPTAFLRTVGGPSANVSEQRGAIAFRDAWRAAPRLQILYGARLDAIRQGNRPLYNAGVDSVFGIATDQRVGVLALSPRVGFNWLYGNNLPFLPRGTLRGGIGSFRGGYSTREMVAVAFTTDPRAVARRIACIGASVPTPDWESFLDDQTTIPSSCVGETTPTPFASVRQWVNIFDPGLRPPVRHSASLGWRVVGLTPLRIGLTLSTEVVRAIDQPEQIDLNFANVPRFTLTSESGRPVFVSPSGIVAATGATNSVESRMSSEYDQVMLTRSVLQTRGIQHNMQGHFYPFKGSPISGSFGVHYTHSSFRQLRSGFSGTTSGSPLSREWVRSSIPNHDFIVSGTFFPEVQESGNDVGEFPNIGILTFDLRVWSGMRYTPMVAGDVNGDGLANDRAFIFSSADASNPIGSQMSDLMNRASSKTRSCLNRQQGRIAAANSCVGPWSASLTMSLARRIPMRGHLGWTLTAENVLGGLDQLLHGSDDLRGWGEPAIPQDQLLQVTGFDPTQNTFVYTVNNGFGRALRMPYRIPFRLSLRFNYSIRRTVSQNEEALELVGLRKNGTSALISVDSLKKALVSQLNGAPGGALLLWQYARTSPLRNVMSLGDSIMLSDDQITQLSLAQRASDRWIDSIATLIAKELHTAKGRITLDSAARTIGWPTMVLILIARRAAEAQTVLDVVAPEQLGIINLWGYTADIVKREESRLARFQNRYPRSWTPRDGTRADGTR